MCFGNICLHSGLCGWLSIKQSEKKSPLLSLNQRSLPKTLIWFGFEGPVSTLISTFDVSLLCGLYNGGQPYLQKFAVFFHFKSKYCYCVLCCSCGYKCQPILDPCCGKCITNAVRNRMWSGEFLIWKPIPVPGLPTLLPPKVAPVPTEADNNLWAYKHC